MNIKVPSTVMNLITKASTHSPAILAGVAVAGVVATGVAAWKAAKKANERGINVDEMSTKEYIKAMAPIVAPPIIIGGVTIGCILAGNIQQAKRIAAVGAAAKVTEQAISKKPKELEKVLNKKPGEVLDDLLKDKGIDEDMLRKAKEQGKTLWIDEGVTGQQFIASEAEIKEAQNKINYMLSHGDSACLNDFLSELNMNCPRDGERRGWSPDKLLEIEFDATLFEGTPVGVVIYEADHVLW